MAVTAPDELGDTQTMGETLRMAQEEVTAVEPDAEVHEVVADKGYHSNETVLELKALGLRSLSVGNGSGAAELEGEQQEIPSAGVRESAAHSGTAGATVTAAAERVGGATVRASVRDRGVASDLRPGARQRAQATADPCLWIQPGIADASPESGVGTPRSLQSRAWTRLFTVIWTPMGHWIARNHPWGRFWASFRPDSLFCAPGIHH